MVKIDFEKIKKHVEYTLNYVVDDEVLGSSVEFSIVPDMKDLPAFMKASKEISKDDGEKFVDWLMELVSRGESITKEQYDLLKAFVIKNMGTLLTQTMIGFRLTTKEKLDEKTASFQEKLEEKQLKNL